jgi:hypothetical protein
VLADREFSYDAPLGLMFAALAAEEGMWWLGLQPGEIQPRVLKAVALRSVVWSSFWPVSLRDTIEFDLSESADANRRFTSRGEIVDVRPTVIRFRWYTGLPPDDRGIAITRQRLNKKFGSGLRSVSSEYYFNGLERSR